MKVIPDDSLVAILSTSDLLIPSSTDDASPATLDLDEKNVGDGPSTNLGNGQTASDVFVGYEQMLYTASVPISSTASSPISRSLTPQRGATGTLDPLQGDSHGDAVARDAWYDHYGRIHHRSSVDKINTLLVTASSSCLAADSTNIDGVPASPPEYVGGVGNPSMKGEGQDGHEEAETTAQARSTTGRPPPLPRQRQAPAARLSNVVPLPLLVFDTQTFLALGELDERFAFQGGIAEWISRAKFARSDDAVGIDVDVAGCCCDASPYRHCRSPRRKRAAVDRGIGTVSEGLVPHVHDSSWGDRFVRPWPESDIQSRCPNDGVRSSRIGEQVFRSQGARTSEDIIIDQWTRLPPAKLEALVQADADLFFLPLMMLLTPHEGEIWRRSCGRICVRPEYVYIRGTSSSFVWVTRMAGF